MGFNDLSPETVNLIFCQEAILSCHDLATLTRTSSIISALSTPLLYSTAHIRSTAGLYSFYTTLIGKKSADRKEYVKELIIDVPYSAETTTSAGRPVREHAGGLQRKFINVVNICKQLTKLTLIGDKLVSIILDEQFLQQPGICRITALSMERTRYSLPIEDVSVLFRWPRLESVGLPRIFHHRRDKDSTRWLETRNKITSKIERITLPYTSYKMCLCSTSLSDILSMAPHVQHLDFTFTYRADDFQKWMLPLASQLLTLRLDVDDGYEISSDYKPLTELISACKALRDLKMNSYLFTDPMVDILPPTLHCLEISNDKSLLPEGYKRTAKALVPLVSDRTKFPHFRRLCVRVPKASTSKIFSFDTEMGFGCFDKEEADVLLKACKSSGVIAEGRLFESLRAAKEENVTVSQTSTA